MITFSTLENTLAICRLPFGAALPAWAQQGDFFSITRTADELSIVCLEELVRTAPPMRELQVEWGWRALKVIGPLDFALTGILARISTTLSDAGISLFAISTYDTDYILVLEENLPSAVTALVQAGYRVL